MTAPKKQITFSTKDGPVTFKAKVRPKPKNVAEVMKRVAGLPKALKDNAIIAFKTKSLPKKKAKKAKKAKK